MADSNIIGNRTPEVLTPIYRFTDVERVLTLIDKNQNTLVSPRKWDDPFENPLSKKKFDRPDGTTYMNPLRDRGYGQCWTITRETDAAWRMYTTKGKGVRLRSTIEKLRNSLYQALAQDEYNNHPSQSCFIGRVKYVSEEELILVLKNLFLDDKKVEQQHNPNVSERQAESLLFKREEFEPEQEIRLLYLDPQNNGLEDTYIYKMDDVSKVIEEITFDPRMDKDLYETLSSILEKLGYKGDINKSKLYRIPDFL